MTHPPCMMRLALALLSLALMSCQSNEEPMNQRGAAAWSLNPEPLPLGLPLPERRESCEVAEGLRLTRIIRGIALQAATPLPCAEVTATSAFGGGSGRVVAATGPWVVHVLELNPSTFQGHMLPALAQDQIAGKARVSEIALQHAAMAAVNAGFFVVGGSGDELSADGVTGDPAGVTVVNGRLLSEAIRGRTTMVWETTDPSSLSFPSVATSMVVNSHDLSWTVDGINRAPGLIRNCGGRGDEPTNDPLHDVTCTDPDELVWYTREFGRDTVPGAGLEAVVSTRGVITEIRTQGGPIPAGGAVLSGEGAYASHIASLRVGDPLVLDTQIVADGEALSGAALAMLNGGPRLLREGQEDLTDVDGGFQHPGDPSFGAVWVSSPQPRSFVGRLDNNHIVFVVVDGRQPRWSVGVALEEGMELMAHLGAVEAMNLDGGGSSTMFVNGEVVNQPSDQDGERAVADAVILVP